MPPLLPVFETVKKAHLVVFTDLKLFLDVVWPWMAGSILAVYGFERLDGMLPLQLALIALHIASISAVISKWSRWLLLRETPQGRAVFSWGKREGNVLFVTIAAGLCFVLPFLLMLYLSASGEGEPSPWVFPLFALQMAGAFVWVRLSLAAVLAALDEKRPLMSSWRLTKGNFWRLLAIPLLAALPLFFAQFTLAYAVAQALGFEESATPGTAAEGVHIFLSALTGFMIMAVVQSAQTLAAQELMREGPAIRPDQPPPTRDE